MKLFSVTCPHCGGKLEVTANSKMVTCEYCNCDFMIDDEVKRVHLTNAEQTGYEFEKGRQRAIREEELAKYLAEQAKAEAEKAKIEAEKASEKAICPHCGATVIVDNRNLYSTCPYCNNIFDVADAIKLYKNPKPVIREQPSVHQEEISFQPQQDSDPCCSYNSKFPRMKRTTFAIQFILLWFLCIVVFGIVSNTWGMHTTAADVILILTLVLSIFLVIRRLHDLNRSAWYFVFAFIPYVNIIFALYLLLVKGTDGPNKYGADPLEGRQQLDVMQDF